MNMNMAVKRSSPEPMDNGMNRGQMQKKPKVQKKKKKRDPNEPQKYVPNLIILCVKENEYLIKLFFSDLCQLMLYFFEIHKLQLKAKIQMQVLVRFQR